MSVGLGSDGGGGAQQSVNLFVSQLGVFVDPLSCEGGVGGGMHGTERSHGRDEHAHGVGVVVETLHHLAQLNKEITSWWT